MAAGGHFAGGSGAADSGDSRSEGPPCRCEEVTIQVFGVRQGAVSSLGLGLGDVAVSREGTALTVKDAPLGATLDLSTDLVAPAVGRVALAEGDAQVSVGISFSGGSATRDELADGLDLCSGPVAFSFLPGQLNRTSCRALVVLDVGRSVVPDAGGLAFIPQYQVFF